MKEEFIKKCLRYAKEHGVHEVAEEVLAKCMRIPDEGIPYITNYSSGRELYEPIEVTRNDDFYINRVIGRYCVNHGVCIFFTPNAEAYLTKSANVLTLLLAAGYHYAPMYVPLSSKETIAAGKDTKELRERWLEISNVDDPIHEIVKE